MSTKRVILYGVLLGTMLLILLSFIGVMLVERQYAPSPERREEEEAVFVVGQWDGHLAVFENGDDTPSRLYEDIWIVSFPPQEQERLKAGIRVTSQAELHGVLEDYTS